MRLWDGELIFANSAPLTLIGILFVMIQAIYIYMVKMKCLQSCTQNIMVSHKFQVPVTKSTRFRPRYLATRLIQDSFKQ